jgi:hypothetical protein
VLKRSAISTAILAAALTAAAPAPDADGWGGAGWYVSSDAPAVAHGARANILFNGPHLEQQDCAEIYHRLYSPIGACRYLPVKPSAHSG